MLQCLETYSLVYKRACLYFLRGRGLVSSEVAIKLALQPLLDCSIDTHCRNLTASVDMPVVVARTRSGMRRDPWSVSFCSGTGYYRSGDCLRSVIKMTKTLSGWCLEVHIG